MLQALRNLGIAEGESEQSWTGLWSISPWRYNFLIIFKIFHLSKPKEWIFKAKLGLEKKIRWFQELKELRLKQERDTRDKSFDFKFEIPTLEEYIEGVV